MNKPKRIFPEKFPILHTERLDLIYIEDHHTQDIYDIYSNENVTKFYDVATYTSIDQAAKTVDLFQRRFRDKIGIRWGIALKGTDQLIGNIGFNRYDSYRSAITGFALRETSWGKGFVSEALAATLEYGFETLKIHRVEAEVLPGNVGSEKVLLKNKFQKEGLLRDYVFWKGKHHNVMIYGRLITD